MKILSLYWGICSSASLFIDHTVVAAAHEERFSRLKNDDAFPRQAILYCLNEAGIDASQLDGVAIASHIQGFDFTILREAKWSVEDYLAEQHRYWYPRLYNNEKLEKIEVFRDKIDTDAYPADYWKEHYALPDRNERFPADREKIVADFLKIDIRKVRRIEHHRCHAAYAYYASKFRNEKVLAFTIDAYGDGLNATIGIFDEKGNYQRTYETGDCNIGRIYRYITLVLGMKPNEHEYKVMGLAPYGKEKYAQKALEVFNETLYVDGIEFKWKVKPQDSYFWFRNRLEGVRFDNVAFALQSWTEDLLTEWIRNAIRKFDIHKIVVSGGVAMNIKAMGKIAALPEVDDMFVGGSGSDESMAISSGICLAEDLTIEAGKNWSAEDLHPLPHLYLGPLCGKDEEDKVIRTLNRKFFRITSNPSARKIAKLLEQGKIVARCAGRMEFGQRALGNRSILADPIELSAKEKINAAIKNRDFWMPFAPVVMDHYVNRYLNNQKKMASPYMTIGFHTTKEGYKAMPGACHPADKSARPQILQKEDNPKLYDILMAFDKITGRGALLNTSFNIHGYPIVNTAHEALAVFEGSGLDALALNHYLIEKI